MHSKSKVYINVFIYSFIYFRQDTSVLKNLQKAALILRMPFVLGTFHVAVIMAKRAKGSWTLAGRLEICRSKSLPRLTQRNLQNRWKARCRCGPPMHVIDLKFSSTSRNQKLPFQKQKLLATISGCDSIGEGSVCKTSMLPGEQ